MSEIVIPSASFFSLLAGLGTTLRRVRPPATFASGEVAVPISPTIMSNQVAEDEVWARRGAAVLARIDAGIEETLPWEQVKAELGL